jgi:hypothetical protein
MYICAAGDIHGAMGKLYDEVLDFEASLGILDRSPENSGIVHLGANCL